MALRNKSGQTAAEEYQEETEEKSLRELFVDLQERLDKLSEQIKTLSKNQEEIQDNLVSKTESLHERIDDACGDVNFRIRQKTEALVSKDQVLKYFLFLIFFCLVTVIMGFKLNSNVSEIRENSIRTNAILANEKVFWYDESNHQLYLDSREKIQHYKASQK